MGAVSCCCWGLLACGVAGSLLLLECCAAFLRCRRCAGVVGYLARPASLIAGVAAEAAVAAAFVLPCWGCSWVLDAVAALLRLVLGTVAELLLLLACVDCTEGFAAPGAVAAKLLCGCSCDEALECAALVVLVRGVALLLPFLDCCEGVDCAEALVAA